MDPKQQASVKVDIKKFSRFMYSHVLQPTDVICSMSPHSSPLLSSPLLSSPLLFFSLLSTSLIMLLVFVKDRVLVLLVTLKDELYMAYYLPVILSDH